MPEPTAENLAGVLEAVTRHGCDVGFCQDPDADRLAVIDEKGRYVGEEYTLAICVAARLRSERGPIVTNCSTSRMSQDLAEQFGEGVVVACEGMGERAKLTVQFRRAGVKKILAAFAELSHVD